MCNEKCAHNSMNIFLVHFSSIFCSHSNDFYFFLDEFVSHTFDFVSFHSHMKSLFCFTLKNIYSVAGILRATESNSNANKHKTTAESTVRLNNNTLMGTDHIELLTMNERRVAFAECHTKTHFTSQTLWKLEFQTKWFNAIRI